MTDFNESALDYIVNAGAGTATDMLAELGESPEAWKGALFVAGMVRDIIGECMLTCVDEEDEDRAPAMMFSIALLTGMVKAVASNPAAEAVRRAHAD